MTDHAIASDPLARPPLGRKDNALAVWGSRDDVREVAQRLKMMMVGARKLSDNECLALGQAAIAHGLDPFNGEIWLIPGSGLMIGVKGLRKKAREQVQGNFWINFREVTDPDERKRRGFVVGAIVYDAHLFDSETLRAYVEAIQQLQKVAAPWDWITATIGEKPYTVGTGIFTPGEKTRMEPDQCARKRAEADALKRRFDVPFGLAVGDSDADPPAFAGDWTVEAQAETEETQAEDPGQHARDKALLFGEDSAAEPTEPPSTNAPVARVRPASDAIAAPPKHKPGNGRPMGRPPLALLRGKVSAKFEKMAAEHAKAFPAYRHKSGQPDLNHILASAVVEGFPTITPDNVEVVFDRLTRRALEARKAQDAGAIRVSRSAPDVVEDPMGRSLTGS
jgi:hypothetical protein